MSYSISSIHQFELSFRIFNLTHLTGKAIGYSSCILKGKNYSATMQKNHLKQIGKDVFLGRFGIFQGLSSTTTNTRFCRFPSLCTVAGEEDQ